MERERWRQRGRQRGGEKDRDYREKGRERGKRTTIVLLCTIALTFTMVRQYGMAVCRVCL